MDLITSLIWICHYEHATFSKSCVSTQFQNHHFPLASEWYNFRYMWTGLPSSWSSRAPTSGAVFPRCGTCHPDKLPSHRVPHIISFPPFFSTLIILAILSITYLKSPFKYAKSSPFSKHSFLIQQFHSIRFMQYHS